MYLDLTTIQYRYTKLLAPKLNKPVAKCKKKKNKKKNNDKLQCHYCKKLKWGLLMSLQWFVLFCEQQIYALALFTKNAIKYCHNRHLKSMPQFLDSGRKSWTLDSGLWMLDCEIWTLDSERWALDTGLWTLEAVIRMLNARLCTLKL